MVLVSVSDLLVCCLLGIPNRSLQAYYQFFWQGVLGIWKVEIVYQMGRAEATILIKNVLLA